MIVETSAIIAILLGEPDWRDLSEAIAGDRGQKLVSAASYVEAAIVIDRSRDPARMASLDTLLDDLSIEIAPLTATQAKIARRAYQQFGKGSGHRAKLNFGDCLAYALSKDRDEPLLFKGNDFVHTDVKPAL